MKSAKKVTTVPVMLARRVGLEGFSTVVGGGYFSTTLSGLAAHFPGATLECLWLTGQSGLGCAEPEWLQHHYPEMGW